MINAIIIEDNRESIKHLKQVLKNFPKIKILGSPAERIDEAINLINTKKPNLVFLDLRLRDGGTRDGFIALNKAKYKNFHLIIFTASNIEECYREAFSYEKTVLSNAISVQYICKKADNEDDELKKAIEYCCSNLPPSEEKIIITISKRRILIENICNIDMCSGILRNMPIPVPKENNAIFCLINGETITSIQSIDSFKDKLVTFFDVGNNYYINKSNIKEILTEEKQIIMRNGNIFKGDKILLNKIMELYDEFRNIK